MGTALVLAAYFTVVVERVAIRRAAHGRFHSVRLHDIPPNSLLENARVCCAVRSRFTGQRLVPLPFSDHCVPLVGSRDEFPRGCDWPATVVAFRRTAASRDEC